MKKNLGIFLCGALSFLLLLAVSGKTVFAHHKAQVLGEATMASQLLLPPSTAGTGLILPDSPLFFLDELSQSLKLALSFSSEKKAEVRNLIAGERLAELRVMLARNNQDGITTTLNQLAKQAIESSNDLTDAAAQGKDVTLLANQLNESLKIQRKTLDSLAEQSTGVLKLQLNASRRALKEAKIVIEDELPGHMLSKEIQEDLADSVDESVKEAQGLAEKLERDLVVLDKQSTEAAQKSIKDREEALKKAIEAKNNELMKAEEKKLEDEKRKQAILLGAQKRASIEAQKAVADAKRAIRNLQRAQDIVDEIRNKPAENVASPSSKSSM